MPASGPSAQPELLGANPRRQPPPRTVAPLGQVRLLFGGGLSQFAWIWFILSSMIGWIFLQNTDVRALTFERGQLTGAPGTIIQGWVNAEGFNDEDIYTYKYRFSTPDGEQTYEGISYSDVLFRPGQAVAVDYHVDNPANSRIRNMRQAPLSHTNLIWIVGLPLFGLLLIAVGLRRGRRAIRLLTAGVLAPSRVVSNTATGMEINDRTVYALVFGYLSALGDEHTVKLKTTDRAIAHDEQSRCVIYDPDRPAEALIVGSLPDPVEVDASGRVELGGPVRNLAVIVFPLLAMLINGCLLASLVR
ncbi:MAG TPA: DUF3592 domain-containing protein [Herpetosiphonaceae bacterium]|nr:DUF3592 domain-containing protein [Herpetosiphonaceae bacterium]